MRTPLLAGLIAVLIPACVNEITGVGGDDEMEMGSGSGSGSNNNGTPNVAVSLDKTTVTTENGKTETVTLTLVSEGGFAGDVTVTSSLLDSASAPIGAIQLAGPPTVTLAAGATQTAAYTIQIPSNTTATMKTAELKLATSSSLGAKAVTSAVTINNFYTVNYPANTGATPATHPNAAMAITLKRGTILRFPNNDTIDHIIHGGNGYTHEGQAVGVDGLPGRTYEIQTTGIALGTTGTVGCHTHGTASYGDYTVE